jgi:hypothetical protein
MDDLTPAQRFANLLECLAAGGTLIGTADAITKFAEYVSTLDRPALLTLVAEAPRIVSDLGPYDVVLAAKIPTWEELIARLVDPSFETERDDPAWWRRVPYTLAAHRYWLRNAGA